ncbi:PDZ domain-containing protein [Actinomadura keratinilytica]
MITEVDGVPVASGEELIIKIRSHRPGDRLDLTVDRDGESRRVTLELGSSDPSWSARHRRGRRGPGRTAGGAGARACPADLPGPATPGTHSRRTHASPEYVQYEGDPGARRARTRRRRLFHEDPPDRP